MDNPEADLRRIAEIACGARLADTAPRNIRVPGYTLGPALGAGVDATVYRWRNRALVKGPADRFQSAAAMLSAVEAIANGR